ncbi:hypothetical protein SLEP1_g14017 [Rubroshorea leprosula]|uniref:WAT1-related protein n=1 Tax=Rubroshorea leprosula TaxID=152421 RepID=A0AAV5IRS5_9ROSI|nr:hypothetical protein SLEP1_g14017 [Rubroshorea leprosula]
MVPSADGKRFEGIGGGKEGKEFCCWWCAGQIGDAVMVDGVATSALGQGGISADWGGIVCNALAFCLATWSIEKEGPLYVSMFSPLSLVIGAILNFALLHEKLFIGTLAGSVLIVAGLYTVLWGKDREIKHMKSTDVGIETKQDDQKGDSERQVKKTNDHPTKVEEKLDVSS